MIFKLLHLPTGQDIFEYAEDSSSISYRYDMNPMIYTDPNRPPTTPKLYFRSYLEADNFVQEHQFLMTDEGIVVIDALDPFYDEIYDKTYRVPLYHIEVVEVV